MKQIIACSHISIPHEIIRHYLENYGGLVITQRQIGKSLALCNILHDNANDIVVVRKIRDKQSFISLYRKYYYEDISDRVFFRDNIPKGLKYGRMWLDEICEDFPNSYTGGVMTVPSIKIFEELPKQHYILKFGLTERLKAIMAQGISEERIICDFTLKFPEQGK